MGAATIHRSLARLGLQRRQSMPAELPWPDDLEEATSRADAREAAVEVDETALASARDAGFGPEVAVNENIESEEGESPPTQQRMRPRVASQKLVRSEGRCSVSFWRTYWRSYEEQGFTIDRDPDDRAGDRALARVGQLEDALPLFGDRPCLRQAGVLLAMPLLVESKLLDAFFSIYHSLGPAFYGLRTTVVVLFMAALLRIKRPENFKEHNPQELGHVVGLDQCPR